MRLFKKKHCRLVLCQTYLTIIMSFHFFLGTCPLPSVKDMMNDIDEKMGKKLKL